MKHTNSDIPILSTKVINDLRSIQVPGEPDIVNQLFDVFIKTSAQRVDHLSSLAHSLVEGEDLKPLSLEAHALRSSALMIGAFSLAEVCEQIERHPEIGLTSEFLLDEVADEVKTVVSEIQKVRQEISPTRH